MNGNGRPSADERRDGASRRLVRRPFARKPAPAAGERRGDDGLDAVRAELMLLREENARLKAERHHPPRVATLLGNAAASAGAPAEDDPGDELAQLMTDYVVMRETLLVACDEFEGALAALRERLAMLPDVTPGGAVETDSVPAELRVALAAPGNGNGNGNGNGRAS